MKRKIFLTILVAGVIILLGQMVGCKPKTHFENLQELAQKGDANAQLELANKYFIGDSIIQDKEKAFEWFQKAAEQDVLEALYKLAFIYELGEIVAKDEQKSLELFEKLSKKGHADSQQKLGNLYHKGNSIIKTDFQKALEFYQMALNSGKVDVQNDIDLLKKDIKDDTEYIDTNLPFDAHVTINEGGKFSQQGATLPNGEWGIVYKANGVTIASLSLGGKNIPLASNKVTNDAMIETKDYGKLSIAASGFSMSIRVTANQEAKFRKLLNNSK